MDEGLIARRYALAMLKVAQKYNAAEEVYQKNEDLRTKLYFPSRFT